MDVAFEGGDQTVVGFGVDEVLAAVGKLITAQTRSNDLACRSVNVILLTDGYDTTSLTKKDELIDFAVRSNAVIYSIGIGDESTCWPRAAAMRRPAIPEPPPGTPLN